MSYITEAHADWHIVNGAHNAACPLDCGAGEAEAEAAYLDSLDEAGLAEYHGVTVDEWRQQQADAAAWLAARDAEVALAATEDYPF